MISRPQQHTCSVTLQAIFINFIQLFATHCSVGKGHTSAYSTEKCHLHPNMCTLDHLVDINLVSIGNIYYTRRTLCMHTLEIITV